jgi:hypothetical protein
MGMHDKDGSALYLAAREGQVETVQLLLDAGPATVEVESSALHVANAKHITDCSLHCVGLQLQDSSR